MISRFHYFFSRTFFVLSCLICSCSFQLLNEDSEKLSIEVLDVGQGDAILISFQEFHALIDVGPPGSGLWEKVESKLRAKGSSHLDWVLISHHHLDHFGGLLEFYGPDSIWVLSSRDTIQSYQGNLSIGKLYTNLDDYSSFEWKLLLQLLEKQSAKNSPEIDTLWAGRIPDLPDAIRGRVLWPFPQQSWIANESSLVLELEYLGSKALFVGDLEEAQEQELMKSNSLRFVDFLKVGHHGSKTSTSLEFLGSLQPHHKAISFGCDNSFGHPHESTIAHLKMWSYIAELEIHDTCSDGDLKYFINQNGLFYLEE